MSSKVVPKLFSGSKVHDSVLPRHQVWFSSFDKSSLFTTSRKATSSPFSSTARRFENAAKSCISDENNNSSSEFTENDSFDGNCNICNNDKGHVNVIDLSKDVSSILGRTSNTNKQAPSSFKAESLFGYLDSTCSSNEESRVQRGSKHLYCNPFLEDEEYENCGNPCQTSGTIKHNKSTVDQTEPLAMFRDERVNDGHNKISQNGSILVVNKSYVGCNNNYENAVGTNHNFTLASDNNNKWELGGVSEQKTDAVVARSLSNESVKKSKKSKRDKINKMVKQGARNYPAYLKLIYTGDSEHSSDDDAANHQNSPNENQLASGNDPSKEFHGDDERHRATPKGIYDRISLFIDDDDDDDDEENSTSDKAEKLDRNIFHGKEDKSWKGGEMAGNNDVMINDDGARNNSTDGPGPNPSEGPHRKNNDFQAKDVHDDDDDDDDDYDGNEVGCLGNDNAVSVSNAVVEYALKTRLTNGDDDSDHYALNEGEDYNDDDDDDDDDDEDDEEDDDYDEEDGVLLKNRSNSLQMIKRKRFIDGGNGGRHGNGNDDGDLNRDEDEDDDDGNEELNRTDAVEKGNHTPHSNLTTMKRETEWMIELFRLEDDIISLKSVLETKIRLAKEIKSRCFYDLTAKRFWSKKIKSLRISDTIRKTNEALKSLSIFACAKIHGASRYMKTNQDPENEIFKVSGQHFSYK